MQVYRYKSGGFVIYGFPIGVVGIIGKHIDRPMRGG